jgi:hypothetical protein
MTSGIRPDGRVGSRIRTVLSKTWPRSKTRTWRRSKPARKATFSAWRVLFDT